MLISMIVAMAKNRVIGRKNSLPWGSAVPEDMKHFVSKTKGKLIIMGYNTYLSLGRPLKGRVNIVLTRKNGLKNEKDLFFVDGKNSALKVAKNLNADEVVVIGGSAIYNLFLPDASLIYLTEIDGEFDGDAFFPELDKKEWDVIEKSNFKKNSKNKFNLTFITYKKNSQKPLA